MKSKNFFTVTALKNLTSDLNMLKKQFDENTEAIEYSLTHVAFELDERTCNRGQLTSLEGIVHMNGQRYPFTAQGKISAVIKLGEGRVKAIVELHSYDKKVWQEFVNLLDDQQKKLDALFKSMRDE